MIHMIDFWYLCYAFGMLNKNDYKKGQQNMIEHKAY